jgi:tetratricopeptide (TPR) repeat protein
MTSTSRLDPDRLAALEEERDFLLASLDDLEDERAAGDIDDTDYEVLKDDYTRRAAEVIRAVEAQEAAFKSVPRAGWKQVAVWVVGLAVLGGLSGVLIARSSGARGGNDTITGDVRASTVSLLNEARALFADRNEWDRAVGIYDQVLQEEPTNTEALTYRGWLQYRLGGTASASLEAFEEVGRLEPGYADGIVFHTIVLADENRYPEAAEVLDRLDLATAPAQIGALLAQRGLVGEVYGEAVYEALLAEEAITLAGLGLDPDRAITAAEYLFTSDKSGRSVVTLKLYRAVQAEEPDNPVALSREAWLLSQTFDPDLEARAFELATRAVEANPAHPEALFTRASILAESDPTTACADLDVLVGLEAIDAEFRDAASGLIDRFCS